MKTKENSSEITFIANQNEQLYLFSGISRALLFTFSQTKDLLRSSVSQGGFQDLQRELNCLCLNSEEKDSPIIVFHLFYELGYLLDERVNIDVGEDEVIGILFEFKHKSPYVLEDLPHDIARLELEIEGPQKVHYEKAFEQGLMHLNRGDCYQYNLTFPFSINFSPIDSEEFLSRCWADSEKVGAYASFTKIESLDLCLFSNSPECLFKINSENGKFYLETFPIKGTKAVEDGDVQRAWQQLEGSEKDKAELMMITDLLRNDLSRLSGEWASVETKREKMVVPGLVHSFSHLRTEIKPSTSLLEIIRCLFPGGSITGAPKVRVMEIINSIEGLSRGFYCGTTLIKENNELSASINIRSGDLCFKTGKLRYHAGGGITVLSKVDQEYKEMWDKVRSFSDLLGACH